MIDLVLFTSTYENVYSGVGTYAKLLVEGLKEAGINFCVVSPDCQEEPPHFIKIKTTSFDPSPNKWISNSFAFSRVLRSFKEKVKVAHFLDAREAFLVKKRDDMVFVGSVHDTYSFDLQSQQILREYFLDWRKRLFYYTLLFKLEKLCYKKFNCLISNTDFVKERLIYFYNINKERVERVYIGAPIKKVENKNKLTKPYVISFIGGNFQRKGLIPLVQAVKSLCNEGIDTKLIVAGRDKNEKEIKSFIHKLGCGDVVHFYGYIPPQNIPSFLMSSHTFAMPSYVEAFGLVYLEAMACGVPVIGTINGGTKEFIKDGVNGFLCNPYNVTDIADKMKRLLNPVTRNRIIENAYATLEDYKIESSIRDTIEIYEKLKLC